MPIAGTRRKKHIRNELLTTNLHTWCTRLPICRRDSGGRAYAVVANPTRAVIHCLRRGDDILIGTAYGSSRPSRDGPG